MFGIVCWNGVLEWCFGIVFWNGLLRWFAGMCKLNSVLVPLNNVRDTKRCASSNSVQLQQRNSKLAFTKYG